MSAGLFGVGISGPRVTDAERAILGDHPPYGVILFRRNLESLAQTQELVRELRSLGVRFLLIDQEGGPVDRLAGILAPFPSFQAAARVGAARRLGELAGSALSVLGFDVNLAPVVDRCTEGAGALVLGERCASDDPHAVLQAGRDFLEGLHARGMGGCLKHFPGLGRARVDTHRAFPVLAPDLHAEALDLAPFDGLMHDARAVMISHLGGPEGLPATLSPERATRLLRDRLGFDGAAFSDDLEMGALDAFGDLPQRCVAAASAGCDLLLVCKRIDRYPECLAAVEAGVPQERRDEAAARLEDYAGHLAGLRSASAANSVAGGPAPTREGLIAQLRELQDALA